MASVRRAQLRAEIDRALAENPAAILLGSRQCGKTTLARGLVRIDSPNYFDLENPIDLRRLAEPMTALAPLRGLVVIDEIHRRPDLFPVLRVLADRTPVRARFLLLGSASMSLLKQTSESLAGRAAIVPMSGFGIDEVGAGALDRLWLRGGYPRSFLATDDAASARWRRDYVQLVLERDVPLFGATIPSAVLHRFWSMTAHTHGGIWRSSDPARSLGIAESTVRRYLDLLTDLLLLRQLQPWHENLGKRQVKSPKVYFRDSGLLHQFLGVTTLDELHRHPRCGASWEGFAIEEVLRCVRPDAQYFWATHAGAELDLLLFAGGRRLGVEVKRADAPGMTRSMEVAREDLRLDGLVVVYPGPKRYSLADDIEVVPLADLADGGSRALFPSLFPRRTGVTRKATRTKARTARKPAKRQARRPPR